MAAPALRRFQPPVPRVPGQLWRRLLQILLLVVATPAAAETVRVAVAANFVGPMTELARQFERRSGHTVRLSSGSSGKLFAQISHAAPFDVFLSADQDKPARLIAAGLALADSRFTYAIGTLALWSPAGEPQSLLASGEYRHLAMANPTLAPYGAAGLAFLQQAGVEAASRSRRVVGENIAQTFQFVATGNAELGLVALSQLLSLPQDQRGQYWLPPVTSYPAIRQDGVLLGPGASNPAAIALLDFLRSAEARAFIEASGYRTD